MAFPSSPRFLSALPPYLGGKRRLAPLIFALLEAHVPRSEWERMRFLDPMCGGGAVALTAKALGFCVTASDASRIGEVVARALVANHSVRLRGDHVAALLRPVAASPGRAAGFVPNVFTADQARWLDHAAAVAEQSADPLRALLQLVIVHTALRLQPMSMLDATDAHHAAEGEFDRISPRRLGHYLRAGRALEAPALARTASAINAGVIGGRGSAGRGDARNVVAVSAAEIVYLDPPYPNTTGYRAPYAPLRTLLDDDMAEEPPSLDELLDVSRHIPWAVISYGGRGVTLKALIADVSRHRRVLRAEAVPYAHLRSLARKEAADANREYIVVAAG